MGMHRKREDVQFLTTSRVERLHLKLIFKLSKSMSVIAFVKNIREILKTFAIKMTK